MGQYSEARKQDRLAKGLCVKCGKSPHEPGVQRCLECQRRDDEKAYQRRYGITRDRVLRMCAEQNDECAICGSEFVGGNYVVDHCHTSGKVRGLLCQTCNIKLGHYESLDLKKIEGYLKRGGPSAE